MSEMLNTMNWQTLQERRLRTRLIMFHKVINENIPIPTHNILHQSQPMTRSSRRDSYRQIQCNKDSYTFSFFCQTIKDWNKLSPDITKNTNAESFKGALTHDVLLDTYSHLKYTGACGHPTPLFQFFFFFFFFFSFPWLRYM